MNRSVSFSDILLPTCSPNRQAAALPALVIVEQQSLHKESFTKDGEQKIAHNVVKNTPFVLKVMITNNVHEGSILDFHRLTIDASLLYDTWEEKLVPYLKNKPIQYNGKVNDTADTMTLNTKINVLSSHCENMMFRVKLRALDARTNEEYPFLVAFSEPIKVISKPDQLPGKAKQTKAAAKPKKRTINDVITESLEKIQEQQRQHHELLMKLYEDNNRRSTGTVTARPAALPLASFNDLTSTLRECGISLSSGGGLSMSGGLSLSNGGSLSLSNGGSLSLSNGGSLSLSNGGGLSRSSGEAKPAEDENALEKAFNNFVEVYNKLNAEQRPEKIRRIVRNSSARKTETFCEIVGLFNDEGLQKELGRDCSLSLPSEARMGAACDPETCPHKKELERIDEFYRDFLMAGPSAPGEDPLPMLFSSTN